MRFIATADTDIGIEKNTNQDSMLVKHAEYPGGEVLLAVICDGMGGLSKGELASATVIREFSRWFDEVLPGRLENPDMQAIGGEWARMLRNLNQKIRGYGRKNRIELGTTFTGMLFINDSYVITHVGDTRAYRIGRELKQLTADQTFIAREISRGTMTKEQAKTDKRRNLLLQCIGASDHMEPDVMTGTCEKGIYMLCSDGFRHEITEEEIYDLLNPANAVDKMTMHSNARYLIELVKQRQERDNISVLLVKVD